MKPSQSPSTGINFEFLQRTCSKDFDEQGTAVFSCSGQYIPDSFKDFINKYERIGKFEDKDNRIIDILAVKLKKDSSLGQGKNRPEKFYCPLS